MDSKQKSRSSSTAPSSSSNYANDSSRSSDEDDDEDEDDESAAYSDRGGGCQQNQQQKQQEQENCGDVLSSTEGYSSFLTSVCNELNAETKVSAAHAGLPPKEKRRLTNRLSARRRRKRRRDELQQLEEDFRRLSSEFDDLSAEKTELQKELQDEVTKTSIANATDQRTTLDRVAARLDPGLLPLLYQNQQPSVAPLANPFLMTQNDAASTHRLQAMDGNTSGLASSILSNFPQFLGVEARLHAPPSILPLGSSLNRAALSLLQQGAQVGLGQPNQSLFGLPPNLGLSQSFSLVAQNSPLAGLLPNANQFPYTAPTLPIVPPVAVNNYQWATPMEDTSEQTGGGERENKEVGSSSTRNSHRNDRTYLE